MDACVHQGRNRMLAKYVEVMKHTSCHTKQAQLLGEYLASAGVEDKINSGKNTSPFFIGAHPFLSDMARMVDRYPENRKAVDYLLCGLLISKDVDKLLGTSAWYAPGAAGAFVVESILHDQKKMVPCSVFLEGEYGESDLCIGVPVILGKNGIEKIVELNLNEDEKAKFAASAKAVHGTNAALKEVGAL